MVPDLLQLYNMFATLFVGGAGCDTTLSQEAAAHSRPVAQYGRDKLRAVAQIMQLLDCNSLIMIPSVFF